MAKTKKQFNIKSLRKKVWTLWSKYIRLRDAIETTWTKEKAICISCEKPFFVSELNAGHFEHGDNMDFVEENVNAQCVHCNKYLHGNLGRYAVNLEKKWGGGVAEDMMRRKASAVKYTKDDLDSIYEYTKGRLEELERYDG